MSFEPGVTLDLWSDLPTNMDLSKYQISTSGGIRNKVTGYILKPSDKEGYRKVGLVHDNGKSRKYYME